MSRVVLDRRRHKWPRLGPQLSENKELQVKQITRSKTVLFVP